MKGKEDERIPILVVGAGPHALAFVTKFLESAVDPFEEHPGNDKLFKRSCQHVEHKLSRGGLRQLPSEKDADIRQKLRLSKKKKYKELVRDIRIVDPHGKWMNQWHSQFEALGIDYLRSAINAHLDPISGDAMRFDLDRQGNRKKAYRSLEHLHKCKTYFGPFEAPSTAHFAQFSSQVIRRYNLEDVVEQGTVVRIDREDDWFRAQLSNGDTIAADRVVVAIGSQRLLCWPPAFEEIEEPRQERETLYHSSSLLADPSLTQQLCNRHSQVLIVGGGLTAGHLTSRFLEHGSHVTLVTRDRLKVRQFDLGLEWMGPKRGKLLADFWSEQDFGKRLSILRESKNGGSITPEMYDSLQDQPRLRIRECTEVETADWEEGEWNIEFTEDDDGPFQFDLVICATGTRIDATQEPLFDGLLSCMTLVNKTFPLLTSDLRVAEDTNVHLLGEYAALRLGPGALNLMGARAGAARVVNSLE